MTAPGPRPDRHDERPAGRGEPGAGRFDVVAVGNAIVDVLTRVEDAFLEDHGLVKGSMALVDQDRSHHLYDAMGPGVEVSGGSAANTVVGVTSLGGRAAFIGRVRDDQLGEVFGHDIRAAGVHYDFPAATTGPSTARCLILVSPDGERTMNTYLGASVEIGPDEIDRQLAADGRFLYVEGYLWDAPEAIDAIALAMDAARDGGRRVAFSLSDGFCVDRHRKEFLDLVTHRVEVLFANEGEICSLFEVDDLDRAIEQLRQVTGEGSSVLELACVTRGAEGSVLVTADDEVEVPAEPAEVVDTTGAGDLYAAGVLHGLAAGDPLERCGRLGSLASAECIAHVGARPLVSLAELAAERLGVGA